MSKYIVSAAALLALLAACAAPGPTVRTNVDPDSDFSRIQTFGFTKPLGTDRPNGVRTPLSKMLASSVIREMEGRGLRQSKNPDVLINFFVNAEQRLDVRQVPTTTSFHGYRRGRYRTWGGYETRVRQYTQGTLAIDVIDPARNMLIWEGTAEGRLRDGDTGITQERADEVVGAVLAKFGQ